MKHHQEVLSLRARGAGLHEITDQVARVVAASGIHTGVCHLFIAHTSASLLLQENVDPTARSDLERWFDRLAPQGDPAYRHTSEGLDDMPSHLRTAVTSTSETVPIVNGRLGLGTWQGIYLFEHRHRSSSRRLVVHLIGE